MATSSQAGAWLLADRLAAGSPVLAVGGAGVSVALAEAGLRPVLPADAACTPVDAVLQGYGPAVTATDLAEAAYAVEGGATWVATNTDGTLPTDRGVAPGNGSLVAAVERAVGHPPHLVAGKPAPPLYLLCAGRLDLPVDRVLAVGDRLDTDIEGAVAAGMDSLLVLTGVDDLRACLEAPPQRRPTWVAPDLRALLADPDDGDHGLVALADAVRAVHAARDAGSDEQRGERAGRTGRERGRGRRTPVAWARRAADRAAVCQEDPWPSAPSRATSSSRPGSVSSPAAPPRRLPRRSSPWPGPTRRARRRPSR